jgi:hypothetical protein
MIETNRKRANVKLWRSVDSFGKEGSRKKGKGIKKGILSTS